VATMTQIPASTQMMANVVASLAANKQPSAEEMLPWLPCTLALEVPVVEFTVGHLLKLQPGSLLRTACHQSSDLPLNVNGVLMAWTEFEVVGERLAARITDLV
jgi:flagellar motor switch/type III secretory pathway protein FliN